jgi:hypothetical protein
MAQPTKIALSLVVPYYNKLAEFRMVLSHNARWIDRDDVELVLVLDEPSEEAQVLALLDRSPQVKARVIVNDRPHEWRTPCVPINVGIRAALGRFVFISSPESAFVGDVPSRAIEVLSGRPDDVLIGRVAWVTFEEARSHPAHKLFAAVIANRGGFGFAADYYGSIAASRELFHAVRGYDESLGGWGGDDDNIRARLSKHGALLMLDRSLRLLHLSEGTPQRDRLPPEISRGEVQRVFDPRSAEANPEQWGAEFGRVARDWATAKASSAGKRRNSKTSRPASAQAGANDRTSNPS